ncbi:MAG: C1q-like domain-containing protein, partial [Clostridium sp.]
MKVCGKGFQIQRRGGGTVSEGENVVFNNLLINKLNGISYNPYKGIFTIHHCGMYYISWWISMKCALGCSGVSFSLKFSDGQVISAATGEKKGEIVGDAYI